MQPLSPSMITGYVKTSMLILLTKTIISTCEIMDKCISKSAKSLYKIITVGIVTNIHVSHGFQVANTF